MKKVHDWLADSNHAMTLHGWFAIFWLVVSVPLALAFGDMVLFVTWLSLYAIVVAHWSSWQSSRTEAAQDKADAELRELVLRLRRMDAEEGDNPMPEKSDV